MKKKPTNKAAKKAPARKAAVGKKHAPATVAPAVKPKRAIVKKAVKPLPSKPTKGGARLKKKDPPALKLRRAGAAKKSPTKRKPRKATAAVKVPVKPGRPSLYSPEILKRICAELSEGRPLTIVCAPEDMPAPRTVRDWIAQNEEVSAAIAGAREEGFDKIAFETLQIANDRSRDVISGGEFGDKPNTAAVQRDKLRIDTRLKLLSKWDPNRYGDKVAVTGAGDKPIPMEITISPESLDAIKIAAAAAATVVAPAAAMSREHLESEDDG